jgi:hypothetical protein
LVWGWKKQGELEQKWLNKERNTQGKLEKEIKFINSSIRNN